MASLSVASRRVVEEAFLQYVDESTGMAKLDVLVQAYDTSKHPTVVLGDLAPSAAKKILRTQLEPSANYHNGYVALDDFLVFHERLQTGLLKTESHVKDPEARFVQLVAQLWNVAALKLEPTGITPLTMELPTGFQASRQMDLIWVDEATGALQGYRGVVKPIFRRADLPKGIQGHFAFADEVKLLNVKYIPPQPAVRPPFDVVWSDNDVLYGLAAVVSSSVDTAVLPSFLATFIGNCPKNQDGKAMDVTFLQKDDAAMKNPMYITSSAAIGIKAVEYAHKVVDAKIKALNGTNPVGIFAGRAGKFTATFDGGMPQSSGFNV